jgi:hypothetical protein
MFEGLKFDILKDFSLFEKIDLDGKKKEPEPKVSTPEEVHNKIVYCNEHEEIQNHEEEHIKVKENPLPIYETNHQEKITKLESLQEKVNTDYNTLLNTKKKKTFINFDLENNTQYESIQPQIIHHKDIYVHNHFFLNDNSLSMINPTNPSVYHFNKTNNNVLPAEDHENKNTTIPEEPKTEESIYKQTKDVDTSNKKVDFVDQYKHLNVNMIKHNKKPFEKDCNLINNQNNIDTMIVLGNRKNDNENVNNYIPDNVEEHPLSSISEDIKEKLSNRKYTRKNNIRKNKAEVEKKVIQDILKEFE